MFVSFRYKRLVFGLKSRDSIFQALMDILLEELQLEGDSQIRMTSSWIQIFRGNVYKILNLSSKYNLTHSSKKCIFYKANVDYLGFHVENYCVSPTESNIEKITSFPLPTTKRLLKYS